MEQPGGLGLHCWEFWGLAGAGAKVLHEETHHLWWYQPLVTLGCATAGYWWVWSKDIP